MDQLTGTVRFASSISDADQIPRALDDVVPRLAQQLDGSADLVMAFVTAHEDDALDQVQRRVAQQLSPRVVLGVTAGGVIGSRREVEQSTGLSILAAKLPGARLRAFKYEQIDLSTSFESSRQLRQTIAPDDEQAIRAIMLLADPFSTPMVKLLPAIDQCWPGIPVVGGMASAAVQPGHNRLLFNEQVLRQGAVGVAIGGDIRVDCTLSQGCRPIGKPYVITKSQRHVVYELGGLPSVTVVQEMFQNLDPSDQQLIKRSGLMVGRVINEYQQRFGRGDFLIRHLAGVDPEAGYIAINDPQVRVGQTIQFHVHDHKTAREDFQLLLEAQKLHGPAGGALLFSCNGRGRDFFHEPDTDAHLVYEALGDVPLAGFFAAGEIGPVGQQNFMHGHTASLVVFRSPAPAGS